MEAWECIAREAIRDLVARYNANGDAGRFDPMLALFTEDAVMELPEGPNGGTFRGVAAIRAFLGRVAENTGDGTAARFIRHFTATHQIDVLGPDEARGRCYYQVLTDRGLDHWGRYIDVYRRVDGRWLFASRRVTLDGFVEGGWARP